MAGQAHHRSARYQRWAPVVTRRAAANPHAVCAICGHTADQHPLGKNGRPQRWHAAHTVPKSHTWQPWLNVTLRPPPGDWLAPALSRCNIADGNRDRYPTSRWL
jgi:hypothetical protein